MVGQQAARAVRAVREEVMAMAAVRAAQVMMGVAAVATAVATVAMEGTAMTTILGITTRQHLMSRTVCWSPLCIEHTARWAA